MFKKRSERRRYPSVIYIYIPVLFVERCVVRIFFQAPSVPPNTQRYSKYRDSPSPDRPRCALMVGCKSSDAGHPTHLSTGLHRSSVICVCNEDEAADPTNCSFDRTRKLLGITSTPFSVKDGGVSKRTLIVLSRSRMLALAPLRLWWGYCYKSPGIIVM